jgi:hypothetical protein
MTSSKKKAVVKDKEYNTFYLGFDAPTDEGYPDWDMSSVKKDVSYYDYIVTIKTPKVPKSTAKDVGTITV